MVTCAYLTTTRTSWRSQGVCTCTGNVRNVPAKRSRTLRKLHAKLFIGCSQSIYWSSCVAVTDDDGENGDDDSRGRHSSCRADVPTSIAGSVCRRYVLLQVFCKFLQVAPTFCKFSLRDTKLQELSLSCAKCAIISTYQNAAAAIKSPSKFFFTLDYVAVATSHRCRPPQQPCHKAIADPNRTSIYFATTSQQLSQVSQISVLAAGALFKKSPPAQFRSFDQKCMFYR